MRAPESDARIVYIRAVPLGDLPAEARAQVGGAAIYAIHDASGNRLALVGDRDLAFVVARQNEMTPVSVH
ncbi:MAG: DUF1150 domain-containing protein [Alphaproteobacteria bacterium HGW-Alphaproteobacteria-8]|nr:MAG: DUF1150 domain-containing protein [Alphaproteobacteria bacterium HGW-Alphaproteobacteria-8]